MFVDSRPAQKIMCCGGEMSKYLNSDLNIYFINLNLMRYFCKNFVMFKQVYVMS